MKPIFEISADTTNLNDGLNLCVSFINSATMLYAIACNGLTKSPDIGMSPPEYWNDHLVTAFFLSRHALELAIKALIKEKTENEIWWHDIEKLWKTVNTECDERTSKIVNEAFDVLRKYHVLHDEQLFRYHTDKAGKRLDQLPPIRNNDIEALSGAVEAMRDEILKTIHLKKGFQLRN